LTSIDDRIELHNAFPRNSTGWSLPTNHFYKYPNDSPFPTTSLFIAIHKTDITKTTHINITATKLIKISFGLLCPFCNSLIRCLAVIWLILGLHLNLFWCSIMFYCILKYGIHLPRSNSDDNCAAIWCSIQSLLRNFSNYCRNYPIALHHPQREQRIGTILVLK
jgi:hypothetical protein